MYSIGNIVKCRLILWLQSPSIVIFRAPQNKSVTVSTVSPSIRHEVMGPDAMILFFCLLTNLDSILKIRDITLPTKVCLVKAMVFPDVWMWQLDYKENWAPKTWCFWAVVLEKTLESPLDCKGIQPVHPKGNQPWIFIERTNAEAETPILWPPDGKNWLIWKDPNAVKDCRREKGTRQRMMVGWHHQLNQHEFE